MSKGCDELTIRIVELLEEDPGQPVKGLAKKLCVNKALENRGYVKSKRIEPAKVYFSSQIRR